MGRGGEGKRGRRGSSDAVHISCTTLPRALPSKLHCTTPPPPVTHLCTPNLSRSVIRLASSSGLSSPPCIPPSTASSRPLFLLATCGGGWERGVEGDERERVEMG